MADTQAVPEPCKQCCQTTDPQAPQQAHDKGQRCVQSRSELITRTSIGSAAGRCRNPVQVVTLPANTGALRRRRGTTPAPACTAFESKYDCPTCPPHPIDRVALQTSLLTMQADINKATHCAPRATVLSCGDNASVGKPNTRSLHARSTAGRSILFDSTCCCTVNAAGYTSLGSSTKCCCRPSPGPTRSRHTPQPPQTVPIHQRHTTLPTADDPSKSSKYTQPHTTPNNVCTVSHAFYAGAHPPTGLAAVPVHAQCNCQSHRPLCKREVPWPWGRHRSYVWLSLRDVSQPEACSNV